MNQMQAKQSLNLTQIKRVLRRRLKPALLTLFVVMLISVLVAFLLPPVYRSSATVLIEQQEIPQDLVRTTVTSFAAQRVQIILQRAMTFSRLNEVIKKYDLYKDMRANTPLEVVVEGMREDIQHEMVSADVVDPRSGRPVEATIAFRIAYQNQRADVAQKVTNELISIVLEENIRNRNEMADQAESFLSVELTRLKEEANKLEADLARFKADNMRSLPEQTSLNISMLDRAEKEHEAIRTRIQNIEERRVQLLARLQQVSPYATVLGDQESSIMSTESRVNYLQSKYMSLIAIYSDDHPDVVKARRELDELTADGTYEIGRAFAQRELRVLQDELKSMQSRYSADHPEIQKIERQISQYQDVMNDLGGHKAPARHSDADNPAYIQLTAEIESAAIELKNLKESRARIEARMDELLVAMDRSPTAEIQYRDILRDLENTNAKYREVKTKQLEAQMAKSLERERKGERFTLIEPPLISERPVRPNRLLIVIVGLFLAIGASAAMVWMLEKMDQTIRSADAVQHLTGLYPLAVVPYIIIQQERLKGRRQLRLATAMAVVAMMAIAAALHLFVMPLDVLVYVAMRKFA